jgi:galactokinase
MKKYIPEINSLRDLTVEQIQKYESEFDPVIFKRCRYVIEENNRVIDACHKLQQGDIEGFGQDMYLSHEGLSADYEVSCDELDFLYQQARKHEGVLGARMMGGGFGGCTINLVKIEHLGSFIADMTKAYDEAYRVALKNYTVKIESGTGKI